MSEMKKSPTLAGVLSLMPGLGQVYVGYYTAGFINALIFAGTIALLNSGNLHRSEPFFGVFIGFFYLFNVIDAVRRANQYNTFQTGELERPAPTDSPLVGGVVLLLVGLLFTLKISFGLELEFLNQVWPLALVLGGIYLLFKYFRVRRQLRDVSSPPEGRGRDVAGGNAGRDRLG